MQVTAPIYEKPSRLSQGLVVGLSIAVVAMAGWLVMTILAPPETTAASEDEPDATAFAPATAPAASPAEATAASGAPRSIPPASLAPAARSVQFDWPEEFNRTPAPPPARTALPLAAEPPAVRDPGPAVVWPAAAPVPDAGNRRIPARHPAPQTGPAPQVGNMTGTDAIVDLLVPPSARDAAATVPAPRPARR